MIKISIPEPCHVQLEKVSGCKKTFYCNSCKHNVPDLSKASSLEVKEYVEANEGGCATFHMRHVHEEKSKYNWINRTEAFFLRLKLKRVALICTLLLVFISGCRKKPITRSKFKTIPLEEEFKE